MVYWVYKDSVGEWRWRLTAANNEIIAISSEGYRNKADCLHAINLVKQSSWNEYLKALRDHPHAVSRRLKNRLRDL